MKGAVALRRPSQTVNGLQSLSTSAYTTILAKASNKKASSGLEIFNASGSVLKIALGDAGGEVDIPYSILPGGSTGFIPIEIPSGVRISAAAVDAATTASQFVINLFA